MKTFVDAGIAGDTTTEHGTSDGVPGVGRFGQPGRIGVPGMSVARMANAPPIFTTVCFGASFATPVWCGHWITALMLQIGGTVFLCWGPARSIATPPRLGNRGRPQ
jgi:hypothetical protein